MSKESSSIRLCRGEIADMERGLRWCADGWASGEADEKIIMHTIMSVARQLEKYMEYMDNGGGDGQRF